MQQCQHSQYGTRVALQHSAKNLIAAGYTKAGERETRDSTQYYLGPEDLLAPQEDSYILEWENEESPLTF
jgi:hypothetical protein